jgi:hypothetical protein
MERLAALEAEVTADAEAQSARKAAAVAKLRDQRVTQTAERDQLRARQAELVADRKKPARDEPRRPRHAPEADEVDEVDQLDGRGLPPTRSAAEWRRDSSEGLGGALELATKANRVKNELSRTPRKGDKSWIASGVASLALGPIGWLYAGSLREAVPATAGWLVLAAIASKILPVFLMMPVLMVVLPLSAIAGVVYALQYNRAGGRQRLFDGDKAKPKAKQLRGG